MTETTEPAIQTSALTKSFGSTVAVDRLDLAIGAGIIFGLLGPNGAGKTTTIKMLTTLLPPTSGTALVAGFDIVRKPRDVRRRIGYVPQLVSADGTLTGYENLLLSATLYGLTGALRKQRIESALTFMDLTGAARRLVKQYSGGMIRRLELAQAMLHEPPILFLDEPTIGLDPLARQAVWERLRELRRQSGTTILITTHDMEEAEALCGELAMMHQGRIAALGAPQELRRQVGPQATLGDVFAHFAGGDLAAEGSFADVQRTRRTAQRLG